jgi:dienelactone hydrolase
MTTQTISLEHQGAVLEGQMALPDGDGPHPAVLVMHNAYGLGQHMTEIAGRLARQGYVAIATDMYGGAAYSEDNAEVMKLVGPLWQQPELLRARLRAWHEWAAARPEVDADRMAAIGYCFGGQCVLELARSGADLKLVVSYHGLLQTASPARKGGIKSHVVVFTGARDPHVPYTHVQGFRDEMIAADASWQLSEFGDAYHSFTDYHRSPQPADGIAYDPLSERVSWAATLELLAAKLS